MDKKKQQFRRILLGALLVGSIIFYNSQRICGVYWLGDISQPFHYYAELAREVPGVYKMDVIGKTLQFNLNPYRICENFISLVTAGNFALLFMFFFFACAGALLYLSILKTDTKIGHFVLYAFIYMIAIELYNFLFNGFSTIYFDIENWFIYLIGLCSGYFTARKARSAVRKYLARIRHACADMCFAIAAFLQHG